MAAVFGLGVSPGGAEVCVAFGGSYKPVDPRRDCQVLERLTSISRQCDSPENLSLWKGVLRSWARKSGSYVTFDVYEFSQSRYVVTARLETRASWREKQRRRATLREEESFDGVDVRRWFWLERSVSLIVMGAVVAGLFVLGDKGALSAGVWSGAIILFVFSLLPWLPYPGPGEEDDE